MFRLIERGSRFSDPTKTCSLAAPTAAGAEHSGRGATLSPLGYEVLTRPKSFHLRH